MIMLLLSLMMFICQNPKMASAFSVRFTFITSRPLVLTGQHPESRHRHHHQPSTSLLVMRDASASYWFTVGNTVRVVEDVDKAGVNLKGRTGKVVETWEKCDVGESSSVQITVSRWGIRI